MKLVVSTMKNEAPFLLEWLAYHRSIGFDAFLIFTNDCTDGTDRMLDRLGEMGVVHHRRNEVLRRGPHKSALKWAKEDPLYAEAEWIYVTDADEFLNIKVGNRRVDDLIDAWTTDAGAPDAIPVTWRHFSNDGHIDLPGDFLTSGFQDAEPATVGPDAPRRFVKTLFRRDDAIEKLGLHHPHYSETRIGTIRWGAAEAELDGNPLRPQHALGYEIAQVNHYAVRSVDAYLLKRDRGRANHVNDTLGTAYWDRWNLGGEQDGSILPLLPGARAMRDAMLEDADLAFLDRAGRALAEMRLRELKLDPEIATLRDALIEKSGTPVVAPIPGPGILTTPKSPVRQLRRQQMLERMPKRGRCAEIGVWNGSFSQEILTITQPSELVLIDPWDLLAERSSDEWTHKRHKDAESMGALHQNVVALYGERDDVVIRRGFSAEILETYPDDYFDWVYIDGNHQYEFVRQDIEISYRKVRAGGIIAGDDFFWKRDGRRQVREAVFDAMAACGIDRGTCFSRIAQQFMIQIEKPENGSISHERTSAEVS